MIKKRYFYNVACDCCGELLDPEMWMNDEEVVEMQLPFNNWKTFAGNHYCPNCWTIDDDDSIVTKDGNKYREE